MSKQEKKGLVPVLRFPEFRDKGGWALKELSQVCEINPSTNSLPETFVYIDLESVEAGQLLQIKIISLEGAPSRAQRYLKKGDVIFQMVRPYQKNNYFFLPNDDLDYVASTGYAQLRAYESSAYLFQYLHNDRFVERVLAKCTGSNYPAINSSDLSTILAEVPEPEEQQKIADCLSSVDELITAETQKLYVLKTHKKGLTQQLFPAEGETVPKLRFPEFRNKEEWHEKPLKKVFSIFQGYAFSSKDSTKEGVRWLKIADVGIQYMNASTPSYLPVNHKEEYKNFMVKLDDYVIALTRPILSGELKMAKVDSIYDGALLNQRVGKLVTDENKDFVYCLLQTSRLIKDIEKNIAGNDPPNLSSQQIGDIAVRIPKGNEQKKIADFLTSIDVLITAQAKKVEGLRAHKKGLMQQLFPDMNEVDT